MKATTATLTAAHEAADIIGELRDEGEVKIWQTHYSLGQYDNHLTHERIMLPADTAFRKGSNPEWRPSDCAYASRPANRSYDCEDLGRPVNDRCEPCLRRLAATYRSRPNLTPPPTVAAERQEDSQ